MNKVFAMLFVMLLLSGCAGAPKAPFFPSTGLLYTDIKAPLMTNYNGQKTIKTKGEASSTYVAYSFLSFSVGDVSVDKALKDGMLKNASYADYEWTSILGIYGKLTVNVYGQNQEAN